MKLQSTPFLIAAAVSVIAACSEKTETARTTQPVAKQQQKAPAASTDALTQPEPEIVSAPVIPKEKTIKFLPPVVTDEYYEMQEGISFGGENDGNLEERTSTNTRADYFEPVESRAFTIPPPVEQPLSVVDEQAQFPGGKAALTKFLSENIEYPETAIENEIEGKCYIRFVVDESGNLSNFMVVKRVPDCPECDKEALRVLKKMPNWVPAREKDKPVASYFNLPIQFKLSEAEKK